MAVLGPSVALRSGLLRQRRGAVDFQRAVPPWQSSVVIAAGEDPDLIVKHLIDEPMLFVDSLGPASGKFVFQRLRFTNASERVALVSLE